MKRQDGTEQECLYDLLVRKSGAGPYPMHMPGSKRRALAGTELLPWSIDSTEIDGLDDLHRATGILADAQRRAAELYGSRQCWFITAGSTCSLLCAVYAAVRPGSRVLLARNCHIAAYHAAELLDLDTSFVLPVQDPAYPFAGSIRPSDVDAAFAAEPDISCVILTSPTYEGCASDLSEIAKICRAHGALLIADEAHGAHFGFSPEFPETAVRSGADLVVQSLHKTLPALTQCSLLHLCSSAVDPAAVQHAVDLFETSSPSYPLMASTDSCIRYLAKNGPQAFSAYAVRLRSFREKARELRVLGLCDLSDRPDFCLQQDPGKLVIGCRHSGMTGTEVAAMLRGKFAVETEMAMPGYLLAMTGLMDTQEGFDRLLNGLLLIDRELKQSEAGDSVPIRLYLPGKAMSIRTALSSPRCRLPFAEAAGRISADYLCISPPGIPAAVPGEILSEELLLQLRQAESLGLCLKKTHPSPEGVVTVAAE